MVLPTRLLVGCCLALVASCDAVDDAGKVQSSATPRASATRLPPLEATRGLLELQGEKAWVALPRGAREARPIVLFWDGELAKKTDATCNELFGLAGRVPFVLCVRAQAGPSEPNASGELKGWLRDLKRRFGTHVAGGSVVFIASGSVVPASLRAVREEPGFFSRIVLVSETRVKWSATLAALFAKSGGQRVLWVCQAEECRQHTAHPISWLERQGATGRVADASDSALKALGLSSTDWEWLIDGDQRYRP